MQSIVQSSFLQALTFALLSSVWQMALLWMLLIFILHVFKLSASQKFNIAFITQLSGFVFFIYTLLYFLANKDSLTIFKNLKVFNATQLQSFSAQLTSYAGVVYIIVLIGQLVKMGYSYNSTQLLRRKDLRKIPAQNRVFVQQVAAMLSFKRSVHIYLSSSIKCPLTIGFFKPIILVPLAAVNHLTKEQLEAVILHELAHIKRYDYLLNFVQLFIERFFFFNIFSKMIYDIIEHERENACDDFVLQFRYNCFHYAEALLKLGRLQTISSFAMAVSGKKENILLLRIKRLIHGTNKNLNYSFINLVHCVFALIIALPLIIAASGNSFSKNKKSYTKQVSIVSAVKNQQQVVSITENDPKQKSFTKKAFGKPTLKKDKSKNEYVVLNNEQAAPANFFNASQSLDSLKKLAYNNASSKQIILNNDSYRRALSYQNFKQLEAMLYASGDSINITEDPKSKDSYKKLITIEATDANGNENVYTVIVELYQ